MPYEIDCSHYGLSANIPVAGWFLALPFSFNTGQAELLADWNQLLLLAHLATDREDEKEFRKESSSVLADVGDIQLRITGNQDPPLKLRAVKLQLIQSQQSVGASATLWVFQGDGPKTNIDWKPQYCPFPDWGRSAARRHGWAGEVPETTSKLSYAHFDWRSDKYFTAADLIGPCGKEGTSALANTILSYCDPFGEVSLQAVPGRTAERLTFKDGSRPGRDMMLLGNDPAGRSQVQGNGRGAVLLAHGTFAHLHPRRVIRLARSSSDGGSGDFAALLGDSPLSDTLRLPLDAVDGMQARRPPDSRFDGVFEGLSLWNLQRRGANLDDEPVLL